MKRLLSILAVLAFAPSANAAITLDGRTIEVIDVHLHPGHYGQMNPTGKAFLVETLPPFARVHAPALFERTLDPYGAHIGIRTQTESAGVDHAFLLAVYTHKTTGYFTNTQLEDALLDARNVSNGKRWAYGLASIDLFEGWDDAAERATRLSALSSYFEAHPGLFVGIKLAHAHQAVALDDDRFLGVYDVAAKFSLPVLLHTGFSPFPGAKTEPKYYDPEGLESVVTAYDGKHGQPRVEFVLSHVGQGDARAVRHSFELAERHDNVSMEISALNRPTTIDDEGAPVSTEEPQYPFVLAELKRRGLIDRTIFGTDGPQYAGMVSSYLNRMVDAMRAADYSLDEIAAVLSTNARRVFLTRSSP